MLHARGFQYLHGGAGIAIGVVEFRDCNWSWLRIPLWLIGPAASQRDYVALEIQAYIDPFSILHGGPAPDALVILFEIRDACITAGFDARFRLTFL